MKKILISLVITIAVIFLLRVATYVRFIPVNHTYTQSCSWGGCQKTAPFKRNTRATIAEFIFPSLINDSYTEPGD